MWNIDFLDTNQKGSCQKAPHPPFYGAHWGKLSHRHHPHLLHPLMVQIQSVFQTLWMITSLSFSISSLPRMFLPTVNDPVTAPCRVVWESSCFYDMFTGYGNLQYSILLPESLLINYLISSCLHFELFHFYLHLPSLLEVWLHQTNEKGGDQDCLNNYHSISVLPAWSDEKSWKNMSCSISPTI